MITSGAQIRAARGFLGWSQRDLAAAAGLHVNAVRYWEAQHGRPIGIPSANGYGIEKIGDALRSAGLILTDDPPAVSVNQNCYDRWRTPPIYARWKKQRKQ